MMTIVTFQYLPDYGTRKESIEAPILGSDALLYIFGQVMTGSSSNVNTAKIITNPRKPAAITRYNLWASNGVHLVPKSTDTVWIFELEPLIEVLEISAPFSVQLF